MLKRVPSDFELDDDVDFADLVVFALALAWRPGPNNANQNQACDISDSNDDVNGGLDAMDECMFYYSQSQVECISFVWHLSYLFKVR